MSNQELVRQLKQASNLEAVRRAMNGKRVGPEVLGELEPPVRDWVVKVNKELDDTDENDGGGSGGSAPVAFGEDDTPAVQRTTVNPGEFEVDLPKSLKEAVQKRREKLAEPGEEATRKSDPKPR